MGELVTKNFIKTDLLPSTLYLVGYTQLASGTRRTNCAQQCSKLDACTDFYHTSSDNICYLGGASSSVVYTIQAGNFAYYKQTGHYCFFLYISIVHLTLDVDSLSTIKKSFQTTFRHGKCFLILLKHIAFFKFDHIH